MKKQNFNIRAGYFYVIFSNVLDYHLNGVELNFYSNPQYIKLRDDLLADVDHLMVKYEKKFNITY